MHNVIQALFSDKWHLGIYRDHHLYVELSGIWSKKESLQFLYDFKCLVFIMQKRFDHFHIYADLSRFPLQNPARWSKLVALTRWSIQNGAETPVVVKRLRNQPIRMALVSLVTNHIVRFTFRAKKEKKIIVQFRPETVFRQ